MGAIMKNYGALRFISGVLKFVGWLTVVGAGLFVLIALLGTANTPSYSSPYSSHVGVVLITLGIAFALFLSGILIVACGELIDAIVDIATNTAHLPAMAVNAERTVSFFDHMSARANGKRTDGTVQTNSSIP
jgi:hypothetical protein